MKLFVWTSDYLKNYAPGTIAVAADSVEEARERARAAMLADMRERYDYLYLGLTAHEALSDPDTAERRAQIEADLAREPEVLETGVLLVPGSE